MCYDASHTTASTGLASSMASECIGAAKSSKLVIGTKASKFQVGMNSWPHIGFLFWHNLWVEIERCRHGVVANIMRFTRTQYYWVIRGVKINERNIINEKFAEAVIENRGCDSWSVVNQVRKTWPSLSSVVDGLLQTEDVADVFASKYQALYSSFIQ